MKAITMRVVATLLLNFLVASQALSINLGMTCDKIQDEFVQTLPPSHDHHESRWFLGGELSIWHNLDTKSNTIHIHPEFGFFLNKDWSVGMLLGYGYHGGNQMSTMHELRIAPFVRYYYLHRSPFNLYLDAGVGYAPTLIDHKWTHGFEVGLRPGASLDLAEGLCLCLRIGFIGYKNNYLGEDKRLSPNGFGFHFAPENLMIGIELEF